MVFDPKKLVSEYVGLTILGTAKSEIQEREEQATGILKQVLQQTPSDQQAFDQAVCRETKSVFHGWNYWFAGRNAKIVRQAILQDQEPDCKDPNANRKLVADLLDPEFSKMNFGSTFYRSPELESLRTKYLTGKEELADDLTYILDALPDFRTDGTKLKSALFSLLPAKIIAYVGVLGGGFGFGYGAAKTKQAYQDLEKISDERQRKEAKREFARGSFLMLFSALSMALGSRGFENSPKNVVKLPTAAKEPPVQPNRSAIPEDKLTLFRNPTSKEIIPIPAQRPQPANDNAYALETQPPKPSLALDRTAGQSVQNNSPILGFQRSAPTAQTGTVAMSPAENPAVQMEQGTLVCIGNTQRIVSIARAEPIKVLPVKPLSTPAQTQDGSVLEPPSFVALIDIDGKHIPHASVLNSLYESALQFAASVLPSLAVMMSASASEIGKQNGKNLQEWDEEDILREVRSKYPTLVSENNFFTAQFTDDNESEVKHLKLTQHKGGWGDSESQEVAGKTFDLFMRVRDDNEARQIFLKIARAFVTEQPETGAAIKDENGRPKVVLPDGQVVLEYHQTSPASGMDMTDQREREVRRLPSNEGEKGLKIYFSHPTGKLKDAENVFRTLLNKFGLKLSTNYPPSPSVYDITTKEGQRNWAYHSFYAWSLGLTREEIKSLEMLAVRGHQVITINALLRNPTEYDNDNTYASIGRNFSSDGDESPSTRGRNVISSIDSAIAKGTIDRDITLYRAASYPELNQVWQRFNTSSHAEEVVMTDSGFPSTTLDLDTAHLWNQRLLKNKGVVLEISVPAGTHAAYLDAETIFPDRGYLDFVLARGSKFKVLQAYTDAQGRRILKVEYVPEKSAVPDVKEKPLLREFSSYNESVAFLRASFKAAIVVLGHGSKNQFGNYDGEVAPLIDNEALRLDQKYGKGNWVVVYGGDPANKAKPDVGLIPEQFAKSHGVPIFVFQSDVAQPWGVPSYVSGVHFMPTDRYQDGSGKDQVYWGGMADGRLVGATKGYFGEGMIGGNSPLVSEVIVAGGGPIGAQEVQYAIDHGIPVRYIRSAARNPVEGQSYGAVDEVIERSKSNPRVTVLNLSSSDIGQCLPPPTQLGEPIVSQSSPDHPESPSPGGEKDGGIVQGLLDFADQVQKNTPMGSGFAIFEGLWRTLVGKKSERTEDKVTDVFSEPRNISIRRAESQDPFWLKEHELGASQSAAADISGTDSLQPYVQSLVEQLLTEDLRQNNKGKWLVIEGLKAQIRIAAQKLSWERHPSLYVSIGSGSGRRFASLRSVQQTISGILERHGIPYSVMREEYTVKFNLEGLGRIQITYSGFGDYYMNIDVDPTTNANFPFLEIAMGFLRENARGL